MDAETYEQRAALIRKIDPAWKLPRGWTPAYLASLADHQEAKAEALRKSGWTFHVGPGEVDPDDKRAAQMDPGWYAQRAVDADSGDVSGPFETELQADEVLS
jgi:hypothetical protein